LYIAPLPPSPPSYYFHVQFEQLLLDRLIVCALPPPAFHVPLSSKPSTPSLCFSPFECLSACIEYRAIVRPSRICSVSPLALPLTRSMQAEMEDMKDRKTAPPRSPPPAGDTHTQVGASCPLPAPAEAAEHDNSGLLSLPTQSYEKLVGKEGPAESEGKKNDTNETEVHLSQDASQSYSSGQAWSTLSPEDLTHWGGHMPSQGQPAPAAQAVPVTVTSTSRGTTRTRDRSSSPFLTAAEYMKMPKLGARVPLLSVVDAGRSAGQPPSWVPSSSVPRPTCRGDSIPSLPSWTEVSTSPPSAWNANEGGRLPRSPAVPQARASSPSPPRVQLAMLLRSPPAVTEVNASSPSPPPHPAVTDTDTITLSPSSLPEEVMQSANNYKCGHANELALRMDFTRACMLHCLRKHLTRNPHVSDRSSVFSIQCSVS